MIEKRYKPNDDCNILGLLYEHQLNLMDEEFIVYCDEIHSVEPKFLIDLHSNNLNIIFQINLKRFKYIVDNINILFSIIDLSPLSFIRTYLHYYSDVDIFADPKTLMIFKFTGMHSILHYIQHSFIRYEYTYGDDLKVLLHQIKTKMHIKGLLEFFFNDGLYLAKPEILNLIINDDGINIKLILELIILKDLQAIKWIQRSHSRINWRSHVNIELMLLSEKYLNNNEGTQSGYENIKNMYEFLISDGVPFIKSQIDVIYKELDKMDSPLLYNDNHLKPTNSAERVLFDMELLSDLVVKNQGININLILDLILIQEIEAIKWIQKSSFRLNWKEYENCTSILLSEGYLNNKEGSIAGYENINSIYKFLILDGFPFTKSQINVINAILMKMKNCLVDDDILDYNSDNQNEDYLDYLSDDIEGIEYDYD
jgi:hypothetical protein